MNVSNVSNMCERCGYFPLHRTELKAHCNRKHTCKPILSNINIEDVVNIHWPQSNQPFQCEGCDNRFATKKNMRRHQSRCKHTKLPIIAAASLAAAELAVKLATAELDAVKSSFITAPSTVQITNNTNNTTNNTMIINIAPFGVWKEGHMQHIIDNRPFMINCIKNKGVGICDLLRKMHFDEEYPENCNIRKPLKKEAFIDNHNGGRWVTDLPDKVLQKIVHEIGCVLMEFLNANVKHRINDRILKSFMREVGIAMDWDLDTSEYELDYNDEINETTRTKTHQRMMQLINKCIYEETQKADQKA